jgi:hypothetical protein
MRKLTLFAAAFAALTFNLVACGGPLEANLDGDDAGTADASSADSNQTCNINLQDCDGDGRIGTADCAPYDAASYAGATEMCDAKDNDCDGQIDEGCPSGGQSTTPANTDSDGDGYPDGPADCAPTDPTVNPGKTEVCGNGKDDDCNSNTLDTCTMPVPTLDGTTLTCTFTYPNAAPRTLSVQVYDHKSDLGGWWEAGKSVTDNDKDLALSLAHVEPDVCGFRFSVAEGSPPASWLCMGNGTTAALDSNVGVSCTFAGKSATKINLKIWSHPGGVAYGCSAVWQVNSHPDCNV